MSTLKSIAMLVWIHVATALHLGWLLLKHRGNLDAVESEVEALRHSTAKGGYIEPSKPWPRQ